ncbi:MAG: hypothetical protein HQK55_05025 [Deltaproteobacteria bacterium]|nr:hypothetical protein [Deltaproteobacteria bacterium]
MIGKIFIKVFVAVFSTYYVPRVAKPTLGKLHYSAFFSARSSAVSGKKAKSE